MLPSARLYRGGVVGAFKSFIDWIGRFQVVQSLLAIFKPALMPGLSAILTGAAGYFGGLPLMWILMATALVFMGVIVGIFFIEARANMRTPSNKLRYAGTIVNYDLQPARRHDRRAAVAVERRAGGSQPPTLQRHLDKTQIGVSLHNSASFPISAILVSAETEMEEKKPPRTDYPKAPVLILPGNTLFMMDVPIPMDGHPCEKLEGRLNLKIKYGFPGREKYELLFKGKVEALIRPEGFLQMTYTNWDSQQI